MVKKKRNLGIQLRRLCLRGPSVSDAELRFGKGLNVIHGSSNTGKTYVFQCIDYMMGGSKPPKDIKEAAGYEVVYLEFTNEQRQSFTLQRSIKGGDAYLYECKLDELSEHSTARPLAQRHGIKGESISEFILTAAGFSAGVKVKTNQSNDVASLSVRGLIHFFCVNEGVTQLERSPIDNGIITDRVKNKSIFEFLLTGSSDNMLIKKPKKEIVTARVQAKEEVYLHLIDEAQAEAESFSQVVQQLPENTNIEAELEIISGRMEQYNHELVEKTKKKRSIMDLLTEKRSRLAALNELFSRFSLLKKHYHSDLQRLNFIKEGEYFLEQLQPSVCHTCGQEFKGLQHPHEVEDPLDNELVKESCMREQERIKSQLEDLDGTFESLNEELNGLKEEITLHEQELDTVETTLSSTLAPKLQNEKERLSFLMSINRAQSMMTAAQDRVATLKMHWSATKNSENYPAPNIPPRPPAEPLPEPEDDVGSPLQIALDDLCKIIEQLLVDWDFSSDPRVHFDTSSEDIVVNGTPRQDNGKGTRALLHAAFCLALLQYCKSHGLPHPGFLLLDSPLTTLKEAHPNPTKAQEVKSDIQQSFFHSLANLERIQTIVLENKEPPAELADSNIVEFTKRDFPGERYGFFPIKPKSSDVERITQKV